MADDLLRLKIVVKIRPETKGEHVSSNAITRTMELNRVYRGSVQHFGPFLTVAPTETEGSHFWRVILDQVDPEKLHLLLVQFDDKYEDTAAQDSRAWALLCHRKGIAYDGGVSPRTGSAAANYLLDLDQVLELQSPGGIGSIECIGDPYYLGPVALFNPIFDADEAVIVPSFIAGGILADSTTWGECFVTFVELERDAEDHTLLYAES